MGQYPQHGPPHPSARVCEVTVKHTPQTIRLINNSGYDAFLLDIPPDTKFPKKSPRENRAKISHIHGHNSQHPATVSIETRTQIRHILEHTVN